MDARLSPEAAAEARNCLTAMAEAVDRIGSATGADERRSSWLTYFEWQAKLHEVIPLVGDAVADPGPYTAES